MFIDVIGLPSRVRLLMGQCIVGLVTELVTTATNKWLKLQYNYIYRL